ncbi:MAG: WD40/YVTN/BNR-like repeat-containing protein [Streptosporangiaceae bacterium]
MKHKSQPPTPKPSGRPVTQPVTPPVSAGPPRLVSIAFFNPTSGYGDFETGSTPACSVEVAATSNGGATFAPPVAVAPWCTARPEIAFDDHGDGILYSSTTNVVYVTHDAGRTWAAGKEPGNVLSVEALRTSVWMLTVSCPVTQPSSTAAVCQLTVSQSTDGGRTWRTSVAQPRASPPVPGASAGSGELIRLSQTTAYVLGGPSNLGDGQLSTVPLWYTGDGGRTWTSHLLSCGMPAESVFMSAAPTGALYGACAGQPGLGNQMKSVVASTDGGASWYHPRGCNPTPRLAQSFPGWCVTGFGGGYIGGIVAVSSTTAFIYGDRLGIAKVVGGGAAARYSTSLDNAIFFSPSVGVALGLTPDNSGPAVWHTDNGGSSWNLVTPNIQKS